MVEDKFLLYGGGTTAPKLPSGPSRAILIHELPVASGDPDTSVEVSSPASIGLFRTFWSATYGHSPEGQVMQDAD
ncbi:MAG: hypothetical protein RQ758_01900 [Methanomicrobiaceae archaeon]|nr:hypothetical protein [Methanomicrobiaceae archaeon]